MDIFVLFASLHETEFSETFLVTLSFQIFFKKTSFYSKERE